MALTLFMRQILAPLFTKINSAARCQNISGTHNPRMDTQRKAKIEQVHIEEAVRLRELFDNRPPPRLSQGKFGEEFEIGSQAVVWQYLNARIPLNLDKAVKFAKGLGCAVADFSPRLADDLIKLRGHDDTPVAQDTSKFSEIDLEQEPGLYAVPRVKFKLSAGVSGFAVECEAGNGKPIFFRKDWIDTNGYAPEALFAVRVSGQSMEPSLWDGDLVVINTADAKPIDGTVFAVNFEGEMCIKRLKRDAGQWFACSDNPDQRRYSPKRCTEDVMIIGKAVYRQGERI